MFIEQVVVKNFRRIQSLHTTLAENINIIVGNNETGKTSFLEALQLCLRGQINRRPAAYELHPYLFNLSTVNTYIRDLAAGTKPEPPYILVELYFDDDPDMARYKGKQNSLRV